MKPAYYYEYKTFAEGALGVNLSESDFLDMYNAWDYYAGPNESFEDWFKANVLPSPNLEELLKSCR